MKSFDRLVFCSVCNEWRTRKDSVKTPAEIRCYKHRRVRQKTIGKKNIMGNGYLRIQTETGWQYEHRYIWQLHHGFIPVGFVVHHIDGDKTNNDINNLKLLPRKKHDSIETSHRWDLRRAGKLPPIQNPKQKNLDRTVLVKMLVQGKSLSAIGRHFDTTHDTVKRNIERYGLHFKNTD